MTVIICMPVLIFFSENVVKMRKAATNKLDWNQTVEEAQGMVIGERLKFQAFQSDQIFTIYTGRGQKVRK